MLYLASQSPRRRQLLEQIGLRFSTIEVDVPEQRAEGESAADYVSRVARAKAQAGHALVAGGDEAAVVLGADTEVLLGEQVFGKPVDADDAAAMLQRLQGRSHTVLSVVCCIGKGMQLQAESASQVRFAALDREQIAGHVASGEWQGKAGGYAIQGLAAAFVAHLSGSYSGVMGLPLYETAQLLRRFGIQPGAGAGLTGAAHAAQKESW